MAVQLSPELVDFIATTSRADNIRPTDTGVFIDYPETTRLDLREDGGSSASASTSATNPPPSPSRGTTSKRLNAKSSSNSARATD